MTKQVSKKPVEPVVTVLPDGRILPGVGYNVGDILAALDAARDAVLGVVLRKDEPPAEPAPVTEEETT